LNFDNDEIMPIIGKWLL